MLVVGAAIGAFQGFFFTRFRIPSFVVTLAFFLGLQGVLLLIIGYLAPYRLSGALVLGCIVGAAILVALILLWMVASAVLSVV